MQKTIYIVTKHTYWEHYSAKPAKTEYETKEEALKAANDYESRWFMEDGYYATVHTEKRIVITPEDEVKRIARQALKESFNYKKDAFAYGIYTCWDGSRCTYFITLEKVNGQYKYFLHFPKYKEVYVLATELDYWNHIINKYALRGKWLIGPNEEMSILGGQIMLLPESCRHIDLARLSLDYQWLYEEGLLNIPEIR